MYRIVLVFFALFCPYVLAQADTLEEVIMHVVEGKRAQVGVAVIVDGKDTVIVNNEVRYPMMSVFKFHQALAVADCLDRRGLPLSTEIFIPGNLLDPDTYSPLRDRFPEGNVSLPISELLVYTLQFSDNNACDILFDYLGGTDVVDRYIRSLGIQHFSIIRTEADMHRDLNLCYDNWSTPLASACLLEIFLTRKLFDDSLQSFVRNTMVACTTGADRLVAPLKDTGAVVGHKTGTGDRNADGRLIAINDIGFVLLPDGRRYTIAVFVKDSEGTDEETARIISDVSAAVYQYLVGGCPETPLP